MGHLGLLKARLAKLRRELIEPKGGGGAGGEGFDVAKTGDARIGFVGFPSVGKSTLLCNLAGVYSEVAAYEFTTLTTVPGVIRYKGAKIQLLDLPGIIEGAKDGKGRGKQVIAVARTCTLILMILDVLKPLHHKRLLEHELEGFGIRLNKEPPNITVKKKDKGGLNFQALVSLLCVQSVADLQVPQSELDRDTVKTILAEYKMHNADVLLRCDATAEDLIDVIEGNRIYIPCIYVLNKIDQISIEVLRAASARHIERATSSDRSYDAPNAMLRLAKSSDIVVLAGDMCRLSVSETQLGGRHGLDSVRTDNDERLIQLAVFMQY
ncbi:developmentally-regulated GTP-binding protein 1 [Clonorchis sinensis]|uniref:Developmentally-regulated GTP-binding protein 1 n=1 Tax=Clonorchis sinensis TaxID=79923 RepID=G7Y4J8_CLOSI|nr:developmentally-regulated GTP-binding protein 1 [Clonorchis sinensis]